MIHCQRFIYKYKHLLFYNFILYNTPLFKQFEFLFLNCFVGKKYPNTKLVPNKKMWTCMCVVLLKLLVVWNILVCKKVASPGQNVIHSSNPLRKNQFSGWSIPITHSHLILRNQEESGLPHVYCSVFKWFTIRDYNELWNTVPYEW